MYYNKINEYGKNLLMKINYLTQFLYIKTKNDKSFFLVIYKSNS